MLETRAHQHTLDAFAGDRSFVMSFARGVSVIRAFAHVSRPLSIAEISHRIDIPRAAVRRLLHTLCELGYVTVVGQHYALTAKTLELGNAFLSSNDTVLAAQPVISRLSDRLRTFCALSLQEGDDAMLVCMAGAVDSKLARRLAPGAGSKAPLYASASGMLFLGRLSKAQLDAYFTRVAMLPLTLRTLTEPERVRASVRKATAQGFAVCDQTFANDLRSIAVPVLDQRRNMAAAIIAVVRAERHSDAEIRSRLVPALAEAAQEAGRYFVASESGSAAY